MKRTLYLIRHGATKGNLEKRYVGSTDEEVLPESLEACRRKHVPQVEEVWISPMKRCRQTAEVLYPTCELQVVEDFKECNFGDFEYANYTELNGNPDYQRYIDSGGECGFPGGESKAVFRERVIKAFEERIREGILHNKIMTDEDEIGSLAIVAHGGTIMALLERFGQPHKSYFDWGIPNGCGYVADLVTEPDGEICIVNIQRMEE